MKQKVVIGIGAAVAVIVAVGWFLLLYQPKSEELGKVDKQIDQAKAEQIQLQGDLQRLQTLKEQEPEIDAELARAKSLVPDTADLATYIREATRVAGEAGVTWVKVAPAEPLSNGTLTTVGLTIELQGAYFNVVDYLTRMEELSRAVTFDTIQVSAVSADVGGKPEVTVQLSGRMFASAAAAPAPEQPNSRRGGSSGGEDPAAASSRKAA